MGKDEAELTMGFNGDMLNVFVTSCRQEAFYLIIFYFSSYEMFSYVSHEKWCLRNVGFGNYGSLKKIYEGELNLSSTLAVTSRTLKSEEGLFPRSEQCLISLKVRIRFKSCVTRIMSERCVTFIMKEQLAVEEGAVSSWSCMKIVEVWRVLHWLQC